MSFRLTVRPAFYDDESAIVEIINQAIVEQCNAYTEVFDWIEGSRWYNDLREKSTTILVVESDNKIVGWGNLSLYRDGRLALSYVNEISFYVHKDYRSIGVGKMLIENLEAGAIDAGKQCLVAIMLESNVPSKSLLLKNDYFVFGLIENVVQLKSQRTGHLYMAKHLR